MPSVGGGGSLHSDRYQSVAGPSSSLVQSDGGCLPEELGLSERQNDRFQDAKLESTDVDSGPVTEADELQDLLEELQNRDGFDNLDDVVGSMSGDQQGFRRVAGESDLARSFDDRTDVDAGNGDVELENDIGKNRFATNSVPMRARPLM